MVPAIVPLALAIFAGAVSLYSRYSTPNLRTALNSAAWSGFMSYFLGGVIFMVVLAIALRDPLPAATFAARACFNVGAKSQVLSVCLSRTIL
ncbi:hypothetical protein ACUSIJ_25380 [Pseudochelatococcus sp. B33]